MKKKNKFLGVGIKSAPSKKELKLPVEEISGTSHTKEKQEVIWVVQFRQLNKKKWTSFHVGTKTSAENTAVYCRKRSKEDEESFEYRVRKAVVL